MADPYVGLIKLFAGNYAPAGFAFCNGQLLSIAEYETLFTLIGTTYGGNGQTTFAVPDLRSRLPIHQGTGPGLSTYVIGQVAGTDAVTLMSIQMPSHTHGVSASSGTGNVGPIGAFWAQSNGVQGFAPSGGAAIMNAQSIGISGGNQGHDNLMPTLAVNFIISLFGIFPSQ